MKKLWQKLLSGKDENFEIERHIAGATVRHTNPFEDLPVPRNEEELSKEFIEKWIIPFYMASFASIHTNEENNFIEIFDEINSKVIEKLLGDFNWRTRIVGAYFSALRGAAEFEEVIGNHLLKSEVCYAGAGYCLALAVFNTDKSKSYLKEYLNYYLMRKDLWFDQAQALAALDWVDKEEAEKYKKLWKDFITDKKYWNLESSKEGFSESIKTLQRIKQIAHERKAR